MKFFVPKMTDDLSLAFIEEFSGIAEPWDLKLGVRMGDNFKPTAKARLDKRYGEFLSDYLSNLKNWVPISEKMKAVFESAGLNDQRVEYLPFELYSQQKRKINKQYYVANALDKVACLDKTKSDIDYASSGEILGVKRLYVDECNVPTESCFFRLAECPEVIVFREDLVDRLNEAGVTGLELYAEGERIW